MLEIVGKSRILQVLLVVSGLTAAVIGGALLLDPVGFEASAGVALRRDASLLSEIRAPGGALLASGVLVLVGAFVRRLTFAASLVATVLLLSYGLSRALSIVIDGMPADPLVAAMIFELSLGGMCLFAFLATRARSAGSEEDGPHRGSSDADPHAFEFAALARTSPRVEPSSIAGHRAR